MRAFDLASVEASNNEWQAAAADFAQVLKERPDDARAAQHLGDVMILWGDQLAKAGKDSEAVVHYREALPGRPADKDLLIRLGMALARMERLDESQQVFEDAAARRPQLRPRQAGHRGDHRTSQSHRK